MAPLEIDLKDENGEKRYVLYGSVVHSGSYQGGHYIAKIETNGNWYSISDTSVNTITSMGGICCGENLIVCYRRERYLNR